MECMERTVLIEPGRTVYLPEIDTMKMAFSIKEIKITDLVGISKKIPKGIAKIIWTYGDASSIINTFKLTEGKETLFHSKYLLESIDDCVDFLNHNQVHMIEKIQEKKKDLAQEVNDLQLIIKESKKELKQLTANINKNINNLKHLDIKDDLKRRGVIDYE